MIVSHESVICETFTRKGGRQPLRVYCAERRDCAGNRVAIRDRATPL